MKGKIITILFACLFIAIAHFAYPISSNAEENSTQNAQQEGWFKRGKEKNERQTDEIPQPKGGPEFTERLKKPVSNIVLQQRYPGIVVLQGPTTENKIALTFDDGPDPRFTPQVLDVLNEYNVPATFFLMGARAEANPDLAKRIISEGHIVGNHTYWHPNLVEVGDLETLEREVTQTENTLMDIIGYRTKLFRPPYGFMYNELVEKVGQMDYTLVGWSVDSLDWRERPAEEIAYTVSSNIHPGAIILMHDGGDWDADRTNTIGSLREIIPTLQQQGFEFVTVPELLNIPYKK